MVSEYKHLWSIRPETVYLNHGSFGPSPVEVQRARQDWTNQLEAQPMDFFCQRMENELESVSRHLGQFIGCKGGNLLLVENATVGMNLAASAIELAEGDEVILTDHEYGAVRKIWHRKTKLAGARIVTAEIPVPIESAEAIVSAVMNRVTNRTRAIVISHVTSQTAAVFPVAEVCAAARDRGVPVCIDGPHAVAMRPIDIAAIGCDFYTASCHKWLCAGFGSGFLYVHPRWQQQVQPVMTSWGGSIAGHDKSWKDNFNWIGTRDPASLLSIPAAMTFLNRIGLDTFRDYGHNLAVFARQQAIEHLDAEPILPDSREFYGTMITMKLPAPADWKPATHGKIDSLQYRLREERQIEAPVFGWNGQRCLRVSAHLYNSKDDVEYLVQSCRELADW